MGFQRARKTMNTISYQFIRVPINNYYKQGFKEFILAVGYKKQMIIDYISGMTDRYILKIYNKI